jgi:hypothetical protein
MFSALAGTAFLPAYAAGQDAQTDHLQRQAVNLRGGRLVAVAPHLGP